MRLSAFVATLAGISLVWIPAKADTLLVLPIVVDSIGGDSIKTVNALYDDAIQSQYQGHVRFALENPACDERICALQALSTAGTDQIIYSQLHRLGTKWIFSSTMLSSHGAEPFNQRLTALSMEDMEAVTKRMADALLNHKTIEQVASLDNLTQKEGRKEPERRRSFFSSGGSLGYLWPVGKSFSYRIPSDTIGKYRLKTNSQLVHFTWLNTWELKEDLLLAAELAVEPTDDVPVVGGDLDLDYVPGRGDFSPFFGGGLGLHYVTADADSSPNKRNSGPTLNAEAGLMLFRTYDFHVLMRGRYRLILNTDLDDGFVADVAVTYKMKAIEEKEDPYLTAKIAGFSALALLIFVLIWNSSHS